MTCVQPGASCAGCSDTGDQGDTNTNLVCSNTYKVTSSLYTIYTYKVTTLGKPSLKKNIFLLTFVNKDFSPPPLIIDKKPLRFGGPVRGVTPPFIKVKNNIV